MIGKPRYKNGDIVTFYIVDTVGVNKVITKTGYIYIVDPYGTFEQNDEPSYDIMVEQDNCLYKHIRESFVKPLLS